MSTLNKLDEKQHQVWLGIGGNVGNVKQAIARAILELVKNDSIQLDMVSGLYKTPPWGDLEQDWFLNACFSIHTSLPAPQLLEVTQSIEKLLGREKTRHWGPRIIDIDILAYEGVVLDSESLIIPHPRITEREFVLKPLSDIAPDLMIFGETADHWLNEVEKTKMDKVQTDDNWWQSDP